MLIAFSVTPLGVGEGVGEIVAEAVRVVRASGLPNRTDSMFTTIEGDDWDEVMAVVKSAVDAVASLSPRVSLVLKADLRPGVTGALTSKVETIERYLEPEPDTARASRLLAWPRRASRAAGRRLPGRTRPPPHRYRGRRPCEARRTPWDAQPGSAEGNSVRLRARCRGWQGG